jgi:hypothetical protein
MRLFLTGLLIILCTGCQGAPGTSSAPSSNKVIHSANERLAALGDPIPGLSKAPDASPLAVSIGALDDNDKVWNLARFDSSFITLLIQFENTGDEDLTLMRPVDGATDRLRYPHYDLETRVNGVASRMPQDLGGRCGNINGLKLKDFVTLQPGEKYRTTLSVQQMMFGRGTVPIRFRYTARRDLSRRGISGRDEKGVKERMSVVWEGTCHSNWITVEVKKQARPVQGNRAPTQRR